MSLYGKVLRIFDETSILVNLGRKEGIKRGDRFVIVEQGEEIQNGDSGEALGRLEHIKAELVAFDVQERISILKTEAAGDASSGVPLSTRMVHDSVRISAGGIRMAVSPGDLSGVPSTLPVKKGDLVRRID